MREFEILKVLSGSDARSTKYVVLKVIHVLDDACGLPKC